LHSTLETRATVLDELAAVYQDDLDQMAAQRRLMESVIHAIDEATGHVSLRERVASFVGFFQSIWNYELTVIDDEGITAGEVVIALALIVLGFVVSRRVSHAVATSLHRRLRLDAGATGAIETVTFYVLLVIFVLLSLRTVNFPLTAFTILGGALAIGIGFGSQNVMNNFISGLILMLERPIRSGDLVAVEGSFGTVERIGARSTQIRATDNTHLIVPNSFFLENKVVNWTLSDDIIRTQVNVGVTYGSPTRQVEEILRRVLDENDKILRNPEPVIVFAEFGDNSLNFEVYFWVRARSPMGLRRISSDIRFRIDDLFREVGIVIAFPQRDVHLDTVSPIDVRVVADRPKEPRG
jgi:small-conductance mechanosensitive channel